MLGGTEESNRWATATLVPLLRTGTVPIALDGDRSVSLPELRAIAQVHGPVALVHYDAHADTYDEYLGQRYTHSTPFRRTIEEDLIETAHSVQLGRRRSVYGERDWQDSPDLGLEIISWEEVVP